MNKISFLFIFSIMFLSTISSALAQEDNYVMMYEESFWDRFFGAFSVADNSALTVEGEAGQLIKIKTNVVCDEYSDTQSFYYNIWEREYILGNLETSVAERKDSSIKYISLGETEKVCQPGESFVLTFGILIPELKDEYCDKTLGIGIRHEEIKGTNVVNVDEISSDYEYNGIPFEHRAFLKYRCGEDSPCLSKAGQTTEDNEKFCGNGGYIMEYYYTGDAYNTGVCKIDTRNVKLCSGEYICEDGECIIAPEKIEGWGYDESQNKCVESSYMSDETEPSYFYESKNRCEDLIEISGYEFDKSENKCVQVSYRESQISDDFYNTLAKCENNIIIEGYVFDKSQNKCIESQYQKGMNRPDLFYDDLETCKQQIYVSGYSFEDNMCVPVEYKQGELSLYDNFYDDLETCKEQIDVDDNDEVDNDDDKGIWAQFLDWIRNLFGG